jgi:hypothetical protein
MIHGLFYWLASGAYSLRKKNSQPVLLNIKGHSLELPIGLDYLWSMTILALCMLLNGWLSYFLVLVVAMEAMVTPSNEERVWKLDNYTVKHEYIMSSLFACIFVVPGIFRLLALLASTWVIFYVDTVLVRPLLVRYIVVKANAKVDKKEE